MRVPKPTSASFRRFATGKGEIPGPQDVEHGDPVAVNIRSAHRKRSLLAESFVAPQREQWRDVFHAGTSTTSGPAHASLWRSCDSTNPQVCSMIERFSPDFAATCTPGSSAVPSAHQGGRDAVAVIAVAHRQLAPPPVPGVR